MGNYSRGSSKKLTFLAISVLRSQKKSLIISSVEYFDELKNCGFFRTQKMSQDEISEFLQEAESEYEASLINRIKTDNEFPIQPSGNEACSFCHFQLVCSREQQ